MSKQKQPPHVPLKEYQARRNKVLKALGRSIGVIHAGERHGHGPYRPNPNFEYLTGITDEPGAILLLDPNYPVEKKRSVLFLKPLNPEVERWDGHREFIGSTLRTKYGVSTIFRTGLLGRIINVALNKTRSLACLDSFSTIDGEPSADLQLFQKVAQRVPGIQIVDKTDILARCRAIKSRSEIDMIRQAAKITQEGFLQVMATTKPGMNEFDVQETVEHAYKSNGSRGASFNTIAGGGFNATVLHYESNNCTLNDGELLLLDSGADFGGYAADVTRTIPINGRFSKRQKEIYGIVLESQEAAIKRCRPGATFEQIDQAARKVIEKAGYGDCFFHGTGHHLGLEVHDITPDMSMKPGCVITIEPGIYIQSENIGIRIEDDILITREGHSVLTSGIPKSIQAIEKAMR